MRIIIILIAIVTISVGIFMFSSVSKDDSTTSHILEAGEIRELSGTLDKTLNIRFTRFMGQIDKERDILINASGDWVMYDKQSSSEIKAFLDDGYFERDYFSDKEYECLMAYDGDYSLYYKGKLNVEIMKDVILKTADVVEDNYELSKPTGDAYDVDTLRMYLAVEIDSNTKGIILIEDVKDDSHDEVKLNLMYEIEEIIDNSLSGEDVQEISSKEYYKFKDDYMLNTSKTYYEQLELYYKSIGVNSSTVAP